MGITVKDFGIVAARILAAYPDSKLNATTMINDWYPALKHYNLEILRKSFSRCVAGRQDKRFPPTLAEWQAMALAEYRAMQGPPEPVDHEEPKQLTEGTAKTSGGYELTEPLPALPSEHYEWIRRAPTELEKLYRITLAPAAWKQGEGLADEIGVICIRAVKAMTAFTTTKLQKLDEPEWPEGISKGDSYTNKEGETLHVDNFKNGLVYFTAAFREHAMSLMYQVKPEKFWDEIKYRELVKQ